MSDHKTHRDAYLYLESSQRYMVLSGFFWAHANLGPNHPTYRAIDEAGNRAFAASTVAFNRWRRRTAEDPS